MIKLALCGSPGSGKTTISKALIAGRNGRRLSFADGLRVEVAKGINFANEVRYMGGLFEFGAYLSIIEEMQAPETKEQYRSLLQAWGEFRRDQNPQYWINDFAQRLRSIETLVVPQIICVDDCRYSNEYEFLKERGFTFVLLEDGAYTKELSPAQAAHSSEQAYRGFDYDVVLTFQEGPESQAYRLLEELGVTV